MRKVTTAAIAAMIAVSSASPSGAITLNESVQTRTTEKSEVFIGDHYSFEVPEGMEHMPLGIENHNIWVGESHQGQEPQVSVLEVEKGIDDVLSGILAGKTPEEANVTVDEIVVPGASESALLTYNNADDIDQNYKVRAVLASHQGKTVSITLGGHQEDWDKYEFPTIIDSLTVS